MTGPRRRRGGERRSGTSTSQRDVRKRPPERDRVELAARPTAPTSGTLASHDDADDLPVVDEGVAVAPEDLARQYLRDATDQNNFERAAARSEIEPEARALGQLISEATLDASGQEQRDVPDSTALLHDDLEEDREPGAGEGSVLSNTVRGGSLFDQPEETEEGLEAVAEPSFAVDEVSVLDEHRGPPGTDEQAREQEKRRLRRKLSRNPDRGPPRANGSHRR